MNAHDILGRVKSSIRDRAGRAKKVASMSKSRARRTQNLIEENPLGLFFAAVAVGFIVGTLLPATDVERERLRPIRESVKETAIQAGRQAMQQGIAVVRETVQMT